MWEPGYVDVTATQALQAASEHKSPGARAQAKKFLLDLLKNGPVPVGEIQAAAKAEGVSFRTLERIKPTLGIVAEKEPVADGKWLWKLFKEGETS